VARVPYLSAEATPDPDGALADLPGWDARNALRARAHSPRGLVAAVEYARALQRSTLPARTRELAILQVGYSTGTAYEWAHHIEIGLDIGLAPADVEAIADETAGRPTHLPHLDALTLRAAREMTDGLEVSEATFDELRQHLDLEQLVDLVTLIGHYNGVVRALRTLDVDLEPSARPLLDRFPLGATAPEHTAPRILPLALDDRDHREARRLLGPVVSQDGQVANLLATVARHPDLFRGWMSFIGQLIDGALPPRDRQLLILRTCWRLGCDYERGAHELIGRAVGLVEPELVHVHQDDAWKGWAPFDRALLSAVDELLTRGSLSDATWAVLAGGFDERQLIEVPMLVGHYQMVAVTISSLGVRPDANPAAVIPRAVTSVRRSAQAG
jgi:alkylhydroperoxidase family enzyme